MSVPAIGFRANPARRRTETQTAKPPVKCERSPPIQRRADPSALFITFSSDSDSDDLPCISTSDDHASPDRTRQPVDSVRSSPPRESSWASRSPRPDSFQPRLEREAPPPPAPVRDPPQPAPVRDAPKPAPGAGERVVRRASDSDDSDVRTLKRRSSLPPRSQKAPAQFSFMVVRESKKMVKKRGAEYRLMDGEAAIYFASKIRDGDDSGIGISDRLSSPPPDVLAVVHRQNKGKRATIIDRKLQKAFDDRAAEILGLSFLSAAETKDKARAVRLAIPKAAANYPTSEGRELAMIAETGQGNEAMLYTSKVAHVGPGGTVVDPFENVFFVDSVKNFAVFDERDVMIFMLYKSAEATFNVKGTTPLTPITAFGLALAIIAH